MKTSASDSPDTAVSEETEPKIRHEHREAPGPYRNRSGQFREKGWYDTVCVTRCGQCQHMTVLWGGRCEPDNPLTHLCVTSRDPLLLVLRFRAHGKEWVAPLTC